MTRPRYIFLLFALHMLFCGGVLGQPQLSFSKQPWNIKGDVLILDVGSLSYQGNHPAFPPLNEGACADACARTPGCNAWTFCSSKDGCGSGCSSYVANNPRLPVASGPGENPTIPNPAWRNLTRITGFGPWGVTSNCKYVCNATTGACKPGDAWPYGVCTLKQVPNQGEPEYWSRNSGEGWVSGSLRLPQRCAGLPVRACTRCLSSNNTSSCLKCAQTPAFKVSLIEGAYSNFLTKADGCSSCYNATSPAACVACLTGNKPCADCALQQPDASLKMDVSACIQCTDKLGSKFKSACTQCGLLGSKPQQVSQCVSCLNTMKPLACDKTDYQPGCYNPDVASGACATCASRATNFETCLACMQSTPYSSNCEACAGLDSSKQPQCYNCSKDSRHPGSGCYDCLSYLPDAVQQQQCIGCLTNPKTTREGKQWCFGCQNWCSTFDTRAKCGACLGTAQEAYMTACGCSN